MINSHYKKRYDRFIKTIQNSPRQLTGIYTENHHIIPKCLHGSNKKTNLIELTLREHHIAHWLLWKAYPSVLSLASAFLQMNNKNPKRDIISDFKPLPSRVYESLKSYVYENLAGYTKGKVHLKDEFGNTVVMTSEEYKNQDEYKFHTAGRVTIIDPESGEYKSITSEEYQTNKEVYTLPHKFSKFEFIDNDTGEVSRLTKTEFNEINSRAGYKKLTQLINTKISCYDETGKKVSVTKDEYNTGNYTYTQVDTFPVIDTLTGNRIKIHRDDYELDPARYMTSTKGKVLVKNESGKTELITKQEAESRGLVGHTAGMTSVYDSLLGEYTMVPVATFKKNRNRFKGPSTGKVNAIVKETGIRKQLTKQEFETHKDKYEALGKVSLLFKCRNRLTSTEKLINIYEWHLVSDKYEILDLDGFNRAKELSGVNDAG